MTEAAHGRISRFREDTRDERIAIAREAEHRFGRKIAWGAACGPVRGVFTHLAVPVMTRLRQSERIVLDTLVEAGVARSRADALAWSVRLVGEHAEEWLSQLREAMTSVQKLREEGPALSRQGPRRPARVVERLGRSAGGGAPRWPPRGPARAVARARRATRCRPR